MACRSGAIILSTSLVSLSLIIILGTGCVYAKYHDYADTSLKDAEELILRLKNDTLIVVLPCYHDKERIYQASPASTASLRREKKQKLLMLSAERHSEQTAIISSFQSDFDFCPVLFIPDSLVYALEKGHDRPLFINEKKVLDPSIRYSRSNPIKFIKQFDQQWQIKIGTRIVPNPFPNYYLYKNGLYGHLGMDKYDDMYSRVAQVFSRRFHLYYENPKSRIAL